jgi:hypothetical protein
LDGSQYHKNSERVGRCWWSSCTGAVMGMAAVVLLVGKLDWLVEAEAVHELVA